MRNRKIIVALIALAAIVLLFAVLEVTQITHFIKHRPTATTQSPTPEQKQQEDATNADTKKQALDSSASNSTSQPATNIELSTREESNNTVTVFTKLTNYSDGTCSLTVNNNGKTNTQTAAVVYQPQFSSCAGFSVPIESVGKGTWSITLTVTSNGSSASKTISSKVN